MSNATTKDVATVATTRQMLDELDALMERMLALPIDEADAAGSTETPAVAATLTLLERPAASASAAAPPEPAVRRPIAPAAAEPAPSYVTPLAAAAMPADPAPAPTTVAAPLPTPEALEALPPRLRPRPALSYQFLLWVNRGYDRGTCWLGDRGSWLRGRLGRLVLGVLGLLLLAGAAAWLGWDWLMR